MNPKTIYIILREFLETLLNEEKREKVAVILIVSITALFLPILLATYILTNPISTIKALTGISDTNLEILEDFQTEYGSVYIGDTSNREIPLFFQYDTRWANYPYAGSNIKISGCGPTALAMVVVGLKGFDNITPVEIADYSTKNGWAVDGVGTSWNLMTEGAEDFGLNVSKISTSTSSIVNALEEGKVIIASMKPGTFTKSGHFIVLTGLTEDGLITVNDSYSEKLSNMAFSPTLISSECKGAWEYWVEEEKEEKEKDTGAVIGVASPLE